MISPLPSYDDELLNSAYANVSLIADEAWTFDHEDPFWKLNHSLWIQSCEVTARYEENDDRRPRRVRDVISKSRLAKYGNYEYNERRERMYRPDDVQSSYELRHFRPAEATEPWMLPEVQEHFARLISPTCTRTHQEPSALSILKCNAASKENEIVCSSLQSDWNERSKKRRPKASPQKSGKVGLYDEPLSTCKSEESKSRVRSAGTFIHRRYTVETVAEVQLRSRIESEVVRDIWNPEKFSQRYHQQCHRSQQSRILWQTPSPRPIPQCHQQFYCTLQYQPLLLKTGHQRQQSVLQSPVLSAEVPEFFPKSNPTTYPNIDRKCNKTYQIRRFPSLSDKSCQSEFPCSKTQQEVAALPNARMSVLPVTEANVFCSPQKWIQRIAPPMQIQLASTSLPRPICTSLQPIHDAAIAHCPLQMYEKFLPCVQPSPTAIPVYQRPTELYQEQTPKRKSQGVDFNNLILLTKNSIKMRRGYSKGVQQPLLLEPKQSLRPGQNVVQWYDKDHVRRTKEMVTVNALVSELRSFERKYDHGRASGTAWSIAESPRISSSFVEGTRPTSGIYGDASSRREVVDVDERDGRAQRPLYRDVLANASSGHGTFLENVLEKRYDELEQQAMEQYKNSEESLALRYQELERQAMEQYKNGSAADSCSVSSSEDRSCFNRQSCSGRGQCSPLDGSREKKDSCFLQPQITLLKPKGKSMPNVFHGSSCNNISNPRVAIASRSLSTLTDKSKESKNIFKGASGDKIDMNVSIRKSSKRRLILVSPFERKSEAELTKTTDLREIYSFPQARKNVYDYYRSSEIARNGSGDENITIIQSPSTEVWLSKFWTT